MRIALAQINPTVGDFSGNLKKIADFMERAVAQDAALVMFPELATCGYPPADLLEKDSFVQRAEETLAAIADLTRGAGRPAVLCGSPMRCEASRGKHIRNVAALMEDGAIQFVQQKMLLPFYDVFDEQRYFEPAERQSLTLVKGRPVAITICEDAWNDKMFWPRQLYPIDPVEELMRQWAVLPQPLSGHRLILNISASPYWQGKSAVRQRMIGALAKRHHATVLMVNQAGANDSLIFDGASFAVDPSGQVIAQAASFAEDLLIVDTETATASESVPEATAEQSLWNALVLGTRDYVRKCGFSKALVGLSGGIDSALVAAIAVEALGKENVQGIGMPSEFSSTGSVTDAEQLAQNLGIAFTTVPIKSIYTEFTAALDPFFAGTSFGLAEENLQPRIRGTLLMAVSNKTGAFVLTTGNKSEMACGYCTLYGDMVGALAVIGDVYKTEVYALARYANRDREVIPEATLTKPPSAELRPGQKDTDSLPAYEVLDPILRAYIEDYAAADEIARSQGVDAALVRQVIRLVELSEYKRQQAAPVLKVSRKSFGMGRRFPIAAKRSESPDEANRLDRKAKEVAAVKKIVLSLALAAWAAMGVSMMAQAAPQLSPATAQAEQATAPAAPKPAEVNPFPPVDPKNFTAASPTADEVNAFLKAIWGYDENRIWSVAAILKTPAPGVAKVVVFVADKLQAGKGRQTVFFVTPDGKHAISDAVIDFGAKPFEANRELLQARADGPAMGAAGKDLMLVEFVDLQDPRSRQAQDTMTNLVSDFPQARIVVQPLPIVEHNPFAMRAALYGACVRTAKGDAAYFKYQQAVFDKQASLTIADAEKTLTAAAIAAGADGPAVAACVDTPAAKAQVQASLKLAADAGADMTPMLAVNGHLLPLTDNIPYVTLRRIVAFQANQDGVPVHLQPLLTTLK